MKAHLFAGLSALMLTAALVPFAQVVGASQRISAGVPTPALTAQASTLRSGAFVTVDQSHATTGTARIVEADGQRYLEFDSAFDTARGPAVEVVLYRGDQVPVALSEADYISLAPLQSFSGAQRYAIPADIDLADYGSVAIWCEEFNVTFGYADI